MIERTITPVLWCLAVVLAFTVTGLSSWIWLHYRSVEPAYTRSVMPTVTQLQRIGELAATRIHVTDVLCAEGEGYRGAWLINGDALLSCDVSQAKIVNINVERHTATVCLPPLRAISARVNFNTSQEWSVEKTTWLPWKLGSEQIVRRSAMIHAQELVEAAAGSEQHLVPAKAHAEMLIQKLYDFVDWNVDIEWE